MDQEGRQSLSDMNEQMMHDYDDENDDHDLLYLLAGCVYLYEYT